MINNQPEALVNAIKRYEEEGGGDNSINDLGMMNGRIVRHVKPSEEQDISSQKTLKEPLLKTWPDISISAKTTVSEYLTRLTKTHATGGTQSVQIKKTLEKLKDKYKKEFEYIKEKIETTIEIRCSEQMVVCRTEHSSFNNQYSPDKWVFCYNKKLKPTTAFYMSNIVAHQYETLFKENQWGMVLPKTITRRLIDNEETNALILKFEGRHDSEEFKREFLNATVNGKSTVRIAEDFGLIITRLEVDFDIYNDFKEYDKHHPGQRISDDYHFTVTCHVSPAATANMENGNA